jgi:hypothetical protein
MNREVQVRFCERSRVKLPLPCPTYFFLKLLTLPFLFRQVNNPDLLIDPGNQGKGGQINNIPSEFKTL